MAWNSMKWRFVCGLLAACGVAAMTSEAAAQIQITEIMYDSIDLEPRWEWVEIRNTTSGDVDLNDWVFGDRSSQFGFSNITSSLGNTVVPAGGAAVIYNSTSSNGLNGDPTRFTNAWGSGIQLIPVNSFGAGLNNSGGDRIGLWSSYASYNPGGGTPTTEPIWENAVFELDYNPGSVTNPFPALGGAGKSIAWKGTGDINLGANWVASTAGDFGAYASVATSVPGASINNTNDSGTPGLVLQGGTPPTGKLVISEIMYNPASFVGSNNEAPFEYVEILNNTGALLDFAATPMVFDDLAGTALTSFNLNSGSVPNGEVAVLYNDAITTNLNVTKEMLKAAWEPNVGTTINFIPVTSWPALNNSDDAIGFWDDLTEHATDKSQVDGEGDPDPTLWTNALASVIYDSDSFDMDNPWPDAGNCCSIYLNDLGADPNVGANWIETGGEGDTIGAANPNPISVDNLADHAGGDVGSPGFVPSSTTLLGDFNGDTKVDAADYTVWRDGLGSLYDMDDYNDWKSNFGAGTGSGGIAGSAVPEPTSALLMLIALAGLAAVRRSVR